MADPQHNEHHGPTQADYVKIFIALCICTSVSFLSNTFVAPASPMASMWIIVMVSVIKAVLVAMIFMHLKFDWGRVYFIIVPVSLLTILMVIVLLPDIVLAWK